MLLLFEYFVKLIIYMYFVYNNLFNEHSKKRLITRRTLIRSFFITQTIDGKICLFD